MEKQEARNNMKVVPVAEAPVNKQTTHAAWRKQPYLWLVGIEGDYIVVDVRAKQWIWGEGGCSILNETRLKKLHEVFPDDDLAKFAQLI